MAAHKTFVKVRSLLIVVGVLMLVIGLPSPRTIAQISTCSNMQDSSVACISQSTGSNMGLVAYWRLDETNGNRRDSVGKSTLVSYPNVRSTPGIRKLAAYFNGSNYLAVADNAALSLGTNELTISAWVNIDDKAEYRTILNKGGETNGYGGEGEYYLQYDRYWDRFDFSVCSSTPGTYCAHANSDNFGSPEPYTWYFVVARFKPGQQIDISVNGGVPNVTPTTVVGWDSDYQFYLGHNGTNSTGHMLGVVDEVKIWKRYLSDVEVDQLYHSYSDIIGTKN